ncbi:MAG: T9SS type A sorting domain-containing protein, partial [Candidatus Marinimicrobia bacterium]|nr:T9SS type A sorting domain-containing protein [Candidatus Neomarinimicrobiota bacterium]
EFYDYIVGQHEFSQGFRYLPNPLDLNAPTFDYRFLQSVGPYDISTGDTVRIVWVECVGEGIEGLRANMDNALAAYYTGSEKGSPYVPTGPDDDVHWRLPAPPATPNLSYSPGNNKVKLVWDNIAEVTPDTKTKEIDFAGYKIYRALYSPSNWTLISAMFDTDMFPGDTIHVTNTDGDTLGWVLKSSAPQLTHSFTDSGGVTFWGNTIEAPINGLPYYYSVVAFDAGDPITGLPPAESGKNNYKKNAGGGPEPIVPKAIYEGSKTDFDLSNVKVVPNPYKGTAPFEEIYTSQINFINLPPAAKIMIFSMTGDLIDTIYHDDGTDSESWHLLSRNEQNIVSGLYLFVVETTTDKYIGKFVVIR